MLSQQDSIIPFKNTKNTADIVEAEQRVRRAIRSSMSSGIEYKLESENQVFYIVNCK